MQKQLNINSFFKISPDSLLHIKSKISFDIYIRLGPKKFTKVFSKNSLIENDRLISYIEKGTSEFFVLKSDRRPFIKLNYKSLQTIKKEKKYGSPNAQSLINELAAQALMEIYEDHIFDDDSFELASGVISTYLDIAKTEFTVLAKLIQLAKKKEHFLKHSIMTSIFSLLLAQELNPENEKFIFECGLAGFLHDVGHNQFLAPIDDHSLNLTSREINHVKKHPDYITEILGQIKSLPRGVLSAIGQHHESWNGDGYPKGLKGEDIYLGARVLAVADTFSSMVTPLHNNMPFSPSLAVVLMYNNEKLDQRIVKKFAIMLKIE